MMLLLALGVLLLAYDQHMALLDVGHWVLGESGLNMSELR